jgi:hypothetical protein
VKPLLRRRWRCSGSREPDGARIVEPHDVKDILARAHAECLGILIIPEPRYRGALPPTKRRRKMAQVNYRRRWSNWLPGLGSNQRLPD